MEKERPDMVMNNYFSAEMSDKEFMKLSNFINSNYGIRMPENKKVMVQSRLQKRMRELKINDFTRYFEYVFNDSTDSAELIHMIDVITTNKTEFFREAVHFEFMKSTVLPELASMPRSGKINIWSAGCSSGEEPYTIAMVMEEYGNKHKPLDYSILGTDLSTRVLKMAKNAIYSDQRATGIPMELRKKYLLKSKDPSKKLVRIVPELRNRTYYKRLNFMDAAYQVNEKFDIIFCRNVLIYFDREIQEQVINKLCRNLRPGGFFFLGHSESIMRMNVPLEQIKPTIFRRV